VTILKTHLLIAMTVLVRPAALLAQGSPAGESFQQGQSLGTITPDVPSWQVFWPAAMAGRWMSGKPYSATAVTHTIQMLADGSQIERTQSETLYRDEQGRTRSETNGGKFIRIIDPTAGVAYNLETSAKFGWAQEITVGDNGAKNPQRASKKAIAINPPSRSPYEFAIAQAKRTPNLTVEDLGTQVVNGVQAQGARTTGIIPVGAIGNNRELNTVSERWESKDLGLLVKTVNSDPRFGTTTYDLTKIVLSAPDPSLFRVPPDYTVSPPAKRD
jgi:hypothetical protein